MRCAKALHSVFCNWATEHSIIFEYALLGKAQHRVDTGAQICNFC